MAGLWLLLRRCLCEAERGGNLEVSLLRRRVVVW